MNPVTIIYHTQSGILLACVENSAEIDTVIEHAEVKFGAKFDDADICVERGLTLTNWPQRNDTIIYSGWQMGAPVGGFEYAVRRS